MPSTVMVDQMGHTDGSVQARYAHPTTDMVRRLLDGLAGVSENALGAVLDGLPEDGLTCRR
jgi:hypothetical protein